MQPNWPGRRPAGRALHEDRPFGHPPLRTASTPRTQPVTRSRGLARRVRQQRMGQEPVVAITRAGIVFDSKNDRRLFHHGHGAAGTRDHAQSPGWCGYDTTCVRAASAVGRRCRHKPADRGTADSVLSGWNHGRELPPDVWALRGADSGRWTASSKRQGRYRDDPLRGRDRVGAHSSGGPVDRHPLAGALFKGRQSGQARTQSRVASHAREFPGLLGDRAIA